MICVLCFEMNLRILRNSAWLLAAIGVLLPFFWLGWHCWPASDDYHDFLFLEQHGFLDAVNTYYMYWGGRFTSYVLVFLFNPLHWNEQAGMAILASIQLLLFVLFTFLISLIFRRAFTIQTSSIPVFAALLIFWMCYLPRPVELLFWFTGSWVYLPGLIGIAGWGLLAIDRGLKNNLLKQFLFAFLPFVICGTNELNLILLFCVALVLIPKSIQEDRLWIITLVMLVGGAALALLAPGNSGRSTFFAEAVGNPVHSFTFSLKQSFQLSIRQGCNWLVETPVIFLALFLGLCNSPEWGHEISRRKKLLLLASPLLMPMLYFPFCWGTGSAFPPDRVNNIAFLVMSVVLIFLVSVFLPRIPSSRKSFYQMLLLPVCLVWLYGNPNNRLRSALNDVGKLEMYVQETHLRHAKTLYHAQHYANDVLILAPIHTIPYTIFYGDLDSNSTHNFNRGYAHYHRIKAVICKE